MNKYYQNIIMLLAIILLAPFVLLIFVSKLCAAGIACAISRTILKERDYNDKNEWKVLTKLLKFGKALLEFGEDIR